MVNKYTWRSIQYWFESKERYPRVRKTPGYSMIEWDDMVLFDSMYIKWRDDCNGIPLERFLSGILNDQVAHEDDKIP
jgi:hypothetical protein